MCIKIVYGHISFVIDSFKLVRSDFDHQEYYNMSL